MNAPPPPDQPGDTAPDFSGPSLETLRRIKAQLPGFIEHVSRGKAGHKGQPVVKEPHEFCVLCTKLMDFRTEKRFKPLKKTVCADCTKILNEGHVGLVDDEGRAAFVKLTPELEESLAQFIDNKPGPKVLLLANHQFNDILKAHGMEMPVLGTEEEPKTTDEQSPPIPPDPPRNPPAPDSPPASPS
jgi:hypothetical protein